jgi:hypothetical protein
MNSAWTAADDGAYSIHAGSQSGPACTFEFGNPQRSRSIPYSYLQTIDTFGQQLITLRYTFADVQLALAHNFPDFAQFLDDLVNNRVAVVRETCAVRITIQSEPSLEKSEIF